MIETRKESIESNNKFSKFLPNTTKACLYHDNDNENVMTNKLVQKWQNSNFLKPGQRIIHPALREDFQKVKIDNLIFGRPRPTHRKQSDKEHKKTEKDIHVEDILKGSTTLSSSCYSNGIGKFIGGNECQAMKHEINEKKVYKSAQRELGRSFHRGHIIPEFMNDENYRHGLKTRISDDDAKALLYSSHFGDLSGDDKNGLIKDEDNGSSNMNYAKSHGRYLPGHQRKRNYNWPLDPVTTVFGVKGQDSSRRSSSKGVSEALHHDASNAENEGFSRHNKTTDHVDNYDLDTDITPKASWKDKNHIFGKATSKTNECAADCLQLLEESNGDVDGKIIESDDLGKSVRPGFRNAMTEKVFLIYALNLILKTFK